MSITLILPACGDSTRFPSTRPKFLLTHPHGKSMLAASIEGLELDKVTRIIGVVREQHVLKYGFQNEVAKQFDNRFSWHVLPGQTQSQPETVAKVIEREDIEGPIAIKDCDNVFRCHIPVGNWIGVSRLQDHQLINPSNKSYVTMHGDMVMHIMEKRIISDTFCSGLYCFASAQLFLDVFKDTKEKVLSSELPHMYISHMITGLMNMGQKFFTHQVGEYVDWGTLADWNRYRDEFETIFIDLDGVLVQNSGQFLVPKWGTTRAIHENVNYLRKRWETGKVTIVITTSRTPQYSEVTKKQLQDNGIPYSKIIYGLPHSKRVIVNDYASSNPYPSCYAVNVPRNAACLRDLMK